MKYWEFAIGILDRCAKCKGASFYEETQYKGRKEFLVCCDGCDQCVGPGSDKNQLSWEWNGEQRRIKGEIK